MAITPNNYPFNGGAFISGSNTPVNREDIHTLTLTKGGSSLGQYNPLIGDTTIDIPDNASDDTSTFTKASGDTSSMVSGSKLSALFTAISSFFATVASHLSNTSNPHNVTKSQVGLGNVDNTSDADKPVSTAQQTALNAKQNVISIVQGAPIILDANGNMDLKISDGSFLDGLPESGYEQIGDKFYKVGLMPDGKIWMCENLDYGTSGVYYNNDEQAYGWNGLKYGKLYTWGEAVTVANSISGWHLPSADEWDALAAAVGGSGIAGNALKSTTRWTSGNGADSYGFAAFPAGWRYNSSFYSLGTNARFWTATEYSSNYAYYRGFDTGASMGEYNEVKARHGFSIRLVKD